MIGESITFTGAYRSTVSKNTDTDWHLLPLTKLMVAVPPLKTSYANPDGVSGEVDMSQVNGLTYGNRKGKWAFKLTPGYNYDTIREEIIDFLHGGYFVVTLSTEDYYYKGRITLDEWKSSETGEYITIGYNLEPWRYDDTTEVFENIRLTSDTLTQSVTIPLTRMPASPLINISSISGTLTIRWNGCTWEYSNVNTTQTMTVTSNGVVDTANMKFFKALSGGGTPLQNSSDTMTITFTISSGGSVNMNVRYLGGWL